jgi:hypothetical protein
LRVLAVFVVSPVLVVFLATVVPAVSQVPEHTLALRVGQVHVALSALVVCEVSEAMTVHRVSLALSVHRVLVVSRDGSVHEEMKVSRVPAVSAVSPVLVVH